LIARTEAAVEFRELIVGAERIPYRLVRSARRTLEITVAAGGVVEVRAPVGPAIERIEQRLRARSGWIRTKVADRSAWPVSDLPRRYESGESHQYLGRQYRLRVVTGRARPRIDGARIVVEVADPTDRDAVQRALARWLRQRAQQVLPTRAAKLMELPALRGSKPSRVSLRTMRTRWGSCSTRGGVLLNTSLVRLPTPLIDYVIAHELCHLRERRHGPAFERFLSRVMPDWRERHARLASVSQR
jgi:predicted metal-dependent hydrolase